jgi:hypothetical protein
LSSLNELPIVAVTPRSARSAGTDEVSIRTLPWIEALRRRLAELCYDGPVVTDPSLRHRTLACGSPFEVAQVHGQQTAGRQRIRERHQTTTDRGRIGKIVEGVSDPDDRIHRRNRIIGQDQGLDALGATDSDPGEIQHRR